MSKIYLQEQQCNRNATAKFVNLIMTSTISVQLDQLQMKECFSPNESYGSFVHAECLHPLKMKVPPWNAQ